MPISMRCPGCQTRFDFANDLEGKRIKCKSCGDIFRVAHAGPAKKSRDDDDDRYSRRDDDDGPRARRRDDDDDRPSSRYRRPTRDDDEDRRSRSRRRDDDRDDDRSRRRRLDDEDLDRPRKKTGLLLVILSLGLVGLVAVVVVTILLVQRSGKKKGTDANDLVFAPSRSCPLEVAEKDVGNLVLSDGGNTFGLLRRSEGTRRNWLFEPYDLAAKKRLGRFDLTEVDDPKAWWLSPDGKKLLVAESRGLGWAGDHWLWLWGVDGKRLTQEKWVPFTKNDKNPFDAPALFHAEFVGNDRIITLGSNRSYFVYQIPTFESVVGSVESAEKDGLGKRSTPPHENALKAQWEAAWTADRKRMAIWTGDVYVILNLPDGAEASQTTSARRLAKELWANSAGDPNRVKAGPVAFSPDGSTLAAVIQSDFGNRRVLCLWDTHQVKEPATIPITDNQWNEASTIHWWGNKFIVTHGGKIDGMMIEVSSGKARRQLMAPTYGKYGFTRDGKLWYAAGEERTTPATLHVVDAIDPDRLTGGDDYEQIVELNQGFYLRRLWLEPTGILRQPTRDDPPLKQKLIGQPKE
jgi:hypothetical protein